MEIQKDIVWNSDTYKELIMYLISLGEENYRNFNLKLITTKYEMIGIRIPIIRKLAKTISKTNFKSLFRLCEYKYYEEVLLIGILTSYVDDFDEFTEFLKKYVKFVDNWGICDTVVSSLKVINKNKSESLNLVNYLISDDYNFSKRFGFVILLDYYVEKDYLSVIFDIVSKENSEDYYVNMAISWLLCECYVKFRDETFDFLSNTNLNEFVVRKTISKVNDSFRISKEDKNKLKSVK